MKPQYLLGSLAVGALAWMYLLRQIAFRKNPPHVNENASTDKIVTTAVLQDPDVINYLSTV